MTDVHTKKQRSYNMSMIKGKNTKPELFLRKYLFSKGLRGYRLNPKLLGKPDIIFNKHKLLIFIDGCFWHKCPKCFIKPRTNVKFWNKKINGNIKRDLNVNQLLKKEGWKVIRFWEHEINKNIESCYKKIIQKLKKKPI